MYSNGELTAHWSEKKKNRQINKYDDTTHTHTQMQTKTKMLTLSCWKVAWYPKNWFRAKINSFPFYEFSRDTEVVATELPVKFTVKGSCVYGLK